LVEKIYEVGSVELKRQTKDIWKEIWILCSGVGKSSTRLWLGFRQGVFTCTGWQATLCDPTWWSFIKSSMLLNLT